MKNYIFLLLVFIFGCASFSSKDMQMIKNNYDSINYKDGLNLEEAKIIAQNQVLDMTLSNLYDVQNPLIDEDVLDIPNNAKYWFIYFKEVNKTSSMPFIYMVVIDKKTGKIKFSEDYIKEKKWILESALY